MLNKNKKKKVKNLIINKKIFLIKKKLQFLKLKYKI